MMQHIYNPTSSLLLRFSVSFHFAEIFKIAPNLTANSTIIREPQMNQGVLFLFFWGELKTIFSNEIL